MTTLGNTPIILPVALGRTHFERWLALVILVPNVLTPGEAGLSRVDSVEAAVFGDGNFVFLAAGPGGSQSGWGWNGLGFLEVSIIPPWPLPSQGVKVDGWVVTDIPGYCRGGCASTTAVTKTFQLTVELEGNMPSIR